MFAADLLNISICCPLHISYASVDYWAASSQTSRRESQNSPVINFELPGHIPWLCLRPTCSQISSFNIHLKTFYIKWNGAKHNSEFKLNAVVISNRGLLTGHSHCASWTRFIHFYILDLKQTTFTPLSLTNKSFRLSFPTKSGFCPDLIPTCVTERCLLLPDR